jgi:hypothetical protein
VRAPRLGGRWARLVWTSIPAAFGVRLGCAWVRWGAVRSG